MLRGGQRAVHEVSFWKGLREEAASQDEVMAMHLEVAVDREKLAEFCEDHGIVRLSVFGSALRDDFGRDSDIDALVEFSPDRIPGLFA